MAIKSDYAKGVTAGIKLRAKFQSMYASRGASACQYERDAAIRKLEDKYRDSLGQNDNLGLPKRDSDAWERAGWYRDGVRQGLEYGAPSAFVVVRFNGNGHYTVESLLERTVFADPAAAWARSWAIDPNGHNAKSIDIGYVNGAAAELGVSLY